MNKGWMFRKQNANWINTKNKFLDKLQPHNEMCLITQTEKQSESELQAFTSATRNLNIASPVASGYNFPEYDGLGKYANISQ